MGEVKDVPVGPAEDLHATIPRGRYNQLSARIEKNPDLIAPLTKGDQVGEIVVELEAKEIGRVPLIALQDVPQGGWWEWLRDTILRWFQ